MSEQESIKDFFTKKEKDADKKQKQLRKEHHCNKCIYAQWQGNDKVFCPFFSCVREKL